jgi:hypothetical protein
MSLLYSSLTLLGNPATSTKRIYVKGRIKRQVWCDVFWSPSLKWDSYKMSDFVALLVIEIVYITPIR